jgi:RNA polymerase sigma-70 factor (ECF subfamily)
VDAATLLLPGQSAECRVSLYAVPDTDDIVARSRQGDVAAFRHLFLQHRAEVSRLVFRMMGPRADLEDVVQEVFLQVHRSLKDFRGQSKFTTWLHRVTVNVVLMHRRAARSRPQMVAPLVEDIEVDPRLPPDEDLVRLERMRAFRRVIEKLAEKKRTVFVLHEVEGLSPAEISTIVGAPVLTVRTRLFYARKELASMLRDEPLLAAFAEGFLRSGVQERADRVDASAVKKVVEEIR